MFGQPRKDLERFAIKNLDTPTRWFQFFIYLQQTMILKLQMPVTGVGVSNKRWFEAEHDEVGDACFIGQNQRLVVLREQVELHPDEVDGLLNR